MAGPGRRGRGEEKAKRSWWRSGGSPKATSDLPSRIGYLENKLHQVVEEGRAHLGPGASEHGRALETAVGRLENDSPFEGQEEPVNRRIIINIDIYEVFLCFLWT